LWSRVFLEGSVLAARPVSGFELIRSMLCFIREVLLLLFVTLLRPGGCLGREVGDVTKRNDGAKRLANHTHNDISHCASHDVSAGGSDG
jgi:hypothetical protein